MATDPVSFVERLCRDLAVDPDATDEERLAGAEAAARLAALQGADREAAAPGLARMIDPGPHLVAGELVRFGE